MQKREAEAAIRHLCHEWRHSVGLTQTPGRSLSFSDFFSWLQDRHGSYLSFRSSISVRYDVELWFDEEFGQAGLR